MNIGNPHELSMLELATIIRDQCGSASEITFIPRPEDDPTVRQPDITLAKEVLDWEPKVDLHEGLARTIAWFREHPEVLALIVRRNSLRSGVRGRGTPCRDG